MIRKEIDSNGTTWCRNELGQLHNDGDQPAVIYKSGFIGYFKNGQTHRLSGPAKIYSDGFFDYWIYGEWYTKEEFDNHPLVREYRLKLLTEGLLNG